ncbi:ACP S-malonyltransferase [Streptomyces sp. MP131-18]|uniref:ACP S-malonyltransferase n=1 Tax=Streptomyces sp. MP131-18 TaxID=1857892 RepID=UPI00097BDD9B|nr:ACP S-malonyltransferase [Streptomyces sp. MP131-18]ONK14674.1 Malonyl CoA-acyl carrier protein transacylase [Streptomyces sp. MP131-18]
MLVLVAPGQGSQAPGFLNPWLELPGVADRLRGWSDLVGQDLVRLGTKADADEIRDTAVAQPLLVAAALVSATALFDDEALPAPRAAVGAVAGHSVGELAAAAIAGVFSAEDAMTLVRRRSQAMAEAAAVSETGMSAVLGGDPDAVAARLAELDLTPANNNGGGQIVAAGTLEQLAVLAADRPDRARVRPLNVAGAFHTRHMAPAVADMEAAAAGITPGTPGIRYVSNADGGVVTDGAEVVRRLVSQISSPVRWDLCMETFSRLGATAIVELCPGGTLTALAKRNLPDVSRVAVKGPDTLAAARELIAAHPAQAAEQEHGA